VLHTRGPEKNSTFLNFSKSELVTEAPSSFIFLYPRKFVYGQPLANFSNLSQWPRILS
jgi:hypothetical protein